MEKQIIAQDLTDNQVIQLIIRRLEDLDGEDLAGLFNENFADDGETLVWDDGATYILNKTVEE